MHQLSLPSPPSWGGRRDKAGRKAADGRRRVSHGRREVHDSRCPAHVTLRVRSDLPSLRRPTIFPAVQAALGAASTAHFRLLQFSVQSDHLHLLVEADKSNGLGRGMQGLAIRVARAVNRVLGRRGKVFGDRYHARLLRTPREVRNALVYVLQNLRKHVAGALGVDPLSSARWFGGWRRGGWARVGRSPVARPHTWLAAVGWKRYGPLDVSEGPRALGLKRSRPTRRT